MTEKKIKPRSQEEQFILLNALIIQFQDELDVIGDQFGNIETIAQTIAKYHIQMANIYKDTPNLRIAMIFKDQPLYLKNAGVNYPDSLLMLFGIRVEKPIVEKMVQILEEDEERLEIPTNSLLLTIIKRQLE